MGRDRSDCSAPSTLAPLREPRARGFADPADEEALRQLVVWLEDHKIRALKKDERQHIRDTKSPQWPTT